MEERVSVRISLDSDGFVRRECPTCDREFKWLYTADELAATEPQEGGFYCPYCAVQASPDSWFTAAQVEYLGQAATGWASDQLDQMFNRPGSALNYTPGDRPPTPEPPPEPDDMRRVESQCHPEDPVKVAEDWVKPVHCLICGAEVEQPSVS